jgi:pimeloyl-ACP methyl ester carboxylesterase
MMDMRVVMLERRGVHGAEVDPGAPAFSTKPHRVADVRAGLEATLANAEPQAPVFLVGASEGGDVAAAVAADDPRVTHLILLGTGGGMSQAEELELEIPDMEHHLRGHDGVPMLPLIEVHVVRWLVDTGVLANAEALAFDRRVRKNHPEWFAR